MAIMPVDYDVLADRVQGLEELVRLLLRHMQARNVVPPEFTESLVDSLIDVATGDPRAEAQADRWQVLIEGGPRP